MVCRGQTIGAIVATSQNEALAAAKAVEIEYKPLPSIFNIQVWTSVHKILSTKLLLFTTNGIQYLYIKLRRSCDSFCTLFVCLSVTPSLSLVRFGKLLR